MRFSPSKTKTPPQRLEVFSNAHTFGSLSPGTLTTFAARRHITGRATEDLRWLRSWHHFGLRHKSMSPVETLLQLGDGRDYFVHAWYRAKDHARHGFIVPSEISEHSVVRSQSEGAGSS